MTKICSPPVRPASLSSSTLLASVPKAKVDKRILPRVGVFCRNFEFESSRFLPWLDYHQKTKTVDSPFALPDNVSSHLY